MFFSSKLKNRYIRVIIVKDKELFVCLFSFDNHHSFEKKDKKIITKPPSFLHLYILYVFINTFISTTTTIIIKVQFYSKFSYFSKKTFEFITIIIMSPRYGQPSDGFVLLAIYDDLIFSKQQ